MDSTALALLKSHDYFQGLDDAILDEVAEHVIVRRYEPGETVHQAGTRATHIGFLCSGRLKAFIVDGEGVERLFRFAERGEQIGMISAALVEPMPIGAIAVEPSTVLQLDYDIALALTAKHPSLRRSLSRKLARSVRASILSSDPDESTSITVLFHASPAAIESTNQLLARLHECGESVGLLTDDANLQCPGGRVRQVVENGKWMEEEDVHRELAAWGDIDRVLVAIRADIDLERAIRIVSLSNRAIWCAEPSDAPVVMQRIEAVCRHSEDMREKISCAWLLQDDVICPNTDISTLCARQFNIVTSAIDKPWGRAAANGLERLVHYIRGIQIGLALGGGAARGMAHLGVLKCLEEAGVVIDRIAGTSAGAMTGILYGAGFDPQYLAERFAKDLKPSWLFRTLPRGGYWYLMYKYRRGQFDPMLRNYVKDWRLEQLPIPTSAVTVDLVSGNAVVRKQGDAVAAILESINLPLLSSPIVRYGEALIDGGFVNNVPADVLAAQGCNLIIAVDVLAKIEQQFGNISPTTPAEEAVRPSTIQTLLRTYAVQSSNINAIGALPADARIEPDVSEFGMAEFTKAIEMAAVGEKAAEKELPLIQRLMANMVERRARKASSE